MKNIVIDVRDQDEFDAAHVPNSIHIPLDRFSADAPSILGSLADKPVLLMCQSGGRARLALDQIKGSGFNREVSVYAGGIDEWQRLGLPLEKKGSAPLPILRQVHLVAGTLVVLGWFCPG